MKAFNDYMDRFANAEKEVAEAKAEAEKAKGDPEGKVHEAQVQQALADARYRSLKAEYDSKESLFNIAVDEGNKGRADSLRTELYAANGLRDQRDDAKNKVDETSRALQKAQEAQADAERKQAQAEEKLKKLRADFDRFQKLAKQKEWKFADWLLSQPVIDAFASPY